MRSSSTRLILAQIAAIAVIVIGLLVWPALFPQEFYLHIAILVLLSIIGSVALHLVMRTGRLSLGQAAFCGLGAYTSTFLVMKVHAPFVMGFLGAIVVPGLLALAIGPVVLRLRGVYFALITFALGEVMQLLLLDAQPLTGGADGIFGIPPPAVFLNSPVAYYYFALIVTAACIGFVYALLSSQVGRALDAIGETDNLAEAAGIAASRFRVFAFVVAASMLGIEGSLFAHYLGYISPQVFGFNASLLYVAANVVGGSTSLVGPIIGSAFLVPLPEFLRGFVQYQQILYGAVLLIVVTIAPRGLVGAITGKMRLCFSRRKDGGDE